MRKRVWIILTAVVFIVGTLIWSLLSRPSSDEVLLGRIHVGMTDEEVYTTIGDHPGLVSAGGAMLRSRVRDNDWKSENLRRPQGWWMDGTYITLVFKRRNREWVLDEKTCERTPSNVKDWLNKSLGL